jgi:hypothetical protein
MGKMSELDYEQRMAAEPKFAETYCSQCGQNLGPGDSGVSHCRDHMRLDQPRPSLREAAQAVLHAIEHGHPNVDATLDALHEALREHALVCLSKTHQQLGEVSPKIGEQLGEQLGKDIIGMVRKACDPDKVDAWQNGFWVLTQTELERFAALVAAAKREACAMTLLEAAKVFVKRVDDCVPTIFFFEYQKEYNNLCAAIAEHEQASDVASRKSERVDVKKMNREDIIRMAREAGFSVAWPETVPNFERFAALVAAAEEANATAKFLQWHAEVVKLAVLAEREACAKVVENYAGAWDDQGYALAQAIRARGHE